jgi:Sulfotransferase family
MLCASREAAYVHEPFNPNRSPGWFREPLPYWFLHITHEIEMPYLEDVRRMVRLRYPFGSLVKARSARVVGMNLQQAALSIRDRLARKRLLLKDPMAIFAAEWLAERFGMHVVVLVRHPASFISSIKRLAWGFDYERNWLAQPLLMRDLLVGYESEFSGYRGEVDLVGEGIVVWNAIYDVVSRYRDRHPDWTVLRYEDIASAPVQRFQELYDRLGLAWTERVGRTIARHSSAVNPGDVSPEVRHEIMRDSAAAALTWKTRLSNEEIARIKEATERVWCRFYSEKEWEVEGSSPG